MNKKVGIRHEDKYVMERRVAIPPPEVEILTRAGLEVFVEKSPKRVFKEAEFKAAGAIVTDSLAQTPVVFGVKEMPLDYFEEGKTYIFFSHVIKGQPYNMPMLQRMVEKKCSLIDYETITDDNGRRLIFFGYYAGLAGMINSLWSLGERLRVQGTDNRFTRIQQSHRYNSLAEAEKAVKEVGEMIRKEGLPKKLVPMVIGFTGYGNVSKGAQHIADLLPIKEITPAQLLTLEQSGDYSDRLIYKVVFKEEDLSTPVDENQNFDLKHYYDHPEAYCNQFEKYAPHITVLMNCMYWDDRYPKLLTKDFIESLYKQGKMKLKVIGDVTCDPDGSIEFTHIGTAIEDPVFVYDPVSRRPVMGFEGDGILVMAVDILPSELPRESSLGFGEALRHFVPAIVQADYSASFDTLVLPDPIKRALILHKGRFTPDYEYLQEYL
jgi:alpha-aminoadipic semialdehyde synthase